MKLSFSTLGCPEWSFDRILGQAAALGYDGVEIRGVNGVMDAEDIAEFSAGNAESTKARLRDMRLEIIDFGTSVSFHDEGTFHAMIESGKRAIDVCARMGIPYIRVFGDRIDKPENLSAIADRVAKGIGLLCGHAHGTGVSVLQEVHGDFNTIEAISAVIERAKDIDGFGILWDIEHSCKIYGEEWPRFYEVIRPYIRHTHFKDCANTDGTFVCCPVGEGCIPIPDIYRRLVNDGYDGYYSFEWEKKWVPELQEPEVVFPEYVRYMRALDH